MIYMKQTKLNFYKSQQSTQLLGKKVLMRVTKNLEIPSLKRTNITLLMHSSVASNLKISMNTLTTASTHSFSWLMISTTLTITSPLLPEMLPRVAGTCTSTWLTWLEERLLISPLLVTYSSTVSTKLKNQDGLLSSKTGENFSLLSCLTLWETHSTSNNDLLISHNLKKTKIMWEYIERQGISCILFIILLRFLKHS